MLACTSRLDVGADAGVRGDWGLALVVPRSAKEGTTVERVLELEAHAEGGKMVKIELPRVVAAA